jgi:drug/metabolite transporter (DMT)-like permease
MMLLFYTALVGSIVFGLAAPWFWHDRTPSMLEVLLFLSLGVYGALGHYLFTKAFRFAPASMLSPGTYLQLVWAGLLGWLIFGHVPDALTLAGMLVIAGSGLLGALKQCRTEAGGRKRT